MSSAEIHPTLSKSNTILGKFIYYFAVYMVPLGGAICQIS
jgi:hypothetical protein